MRLTSVTGVDLEMASPLEAARTAGLGTASPTKFNDSQGDSVSLRRFLVTVQRLNEVISTDCTRWIGRLRSDDATEMS